MVDQDSIRKSLADAGTKIISALSNTPVSYPVEVFYKVTPDEPDAYQEEGNRQEYEEEAKWEGNALITGLELSNREGSPESWDQYTTDIPITMYLDKDKEMENDAKIVVTRGQRTQVFKAWHISNFDGKDEAIVKIVELVPLEA